MQNPLVSVIITIYDREKYLQKAVQSVCNQTYKNIEILVIDDGAANKYAELICSQYGNCTYFYKKNGGSSSARNYGINQSKGEFIAFLDDDDFWERSKIEKQIKVLVENIDIDCVHSAAAVVDENDNLTGEIIGASKNKIHKRSGYVFWNALGVWVVKSPTPLIRKSVFKTDMLFDEELKTAEDIDFYQRMFYRHKVQYISEPLAFYREHQGENRLSQQHEKYIGIEKKMLTNFKKMNIKNPFVFYKIKLRLAKSSILRWKQFYNSDNLKISTFKLYINPTAYINKYSKCE
jgi:glycosyltransferase involved in cell wall biosynthesis